MRRIFLLLVSVLVIAVSGCATMSQPKTRVYFVEPKDDANVSQEVKIVMGIEGMEITMPQPDLAQWIGAVVTIPLIYQLIKHINYEYQWIKS